jgi:flagellar M-ring protein FliF
VQSARVHLAVEAPSVFLRDRTRRAASVMLRLNPGRSLGDAQVQAIVHLVASSVPGLAPEGVSVVDQSGRLLSSGDGEAGAASDRQVAIQAKIEERYARALDALLTPIVGAGNFTAEVHADVDFSEVQATREGFPQDASTISREERAWTAAAAKEEEAAGIPGTMSNQAPTATEVAAAPGAKIDPKAAGADAAGETAGKVQENYTRNFAIGREVSVTRKPTGEVKRLTVAVAIRNPEGGTRSKQELARIEALVKGAVGYSTARGDVVALDALSFADAEAFEENWWDAEWVSMLARNVAGLGVAALLIFAVVLPMLRRTGLIGGKGAAAPAARPAAGASAGPAAPSPAAAREMASMMQEAAADPLDQTLRLFETAHSYEARAVLIRDFVRQNPERAALAVRDLLRTDKNDGGDRHG